MSEYRTSNDQRRAGCGPEERRSISAGRWGTRMTGSAWCFISSHAAEEQAPDKQRPPESPFAPLQKCAQSDPKSVACVETRAADHASRSWAWQSFRIGMQPHAPPTPPGIPHSPSLPRKADGARPVRIPDDEMRQLLSGGVAGNDPFRRHDCPIFAVVPACPPCILGVAQRKSLAAGLLGSSHATKD